MYSRHLLFFVLAAAFFSSCKQKEGHLFARLSSSDTGIDFANNLESRPAFNILYYLYYYNGGGVAIGDVNNDGLTDIYFTANSKGSNKLYLNKGRLQFEDVTQKAGVAGTSDWCTGATMADVNGDGYLDIYVSAVNIPGKLKSRNELFLNNGNGTFTESAAQYGLDFSGFSTQAAFFDYDHDGDLDCYLLNQSHRPNENIVDTGNRRKANAAAGDRLYRNDSLRFTDVSAQAGIYQSSLGYGLGLAIADLNNDGWEDIYVGNDFHENDYYYLNNGNGSFTESGAKHFGHYSRFSMGNDVADYNNDGQLDIVTVDMLPEDEKVLKTYGSDENPDIYRFKLINNGFQHQYSRNCLQRNNGNGSSFSEVALLAGIPATDWSWCPLFADFDNDGNKDLFISSGIVKRPVDLDYVRFVSALSFQKGMDQTDKYDNLALEKMPDGRSHSYIFKGDGHLKFDDKSEAWGLKENKGYHNGAAYADLDNDGDLDLVVNSLNAPASVYRNDAPKKNFLSLSLKGERPNTAGIGAKAYLFAKGRLQYQQLMPTRGFQSASDTRLHFGLDSLTTVDSILIVWPDQKFQVLRNVPANKPLTVTQKNAAGVFTYTGFFPPALPYLTTANGITANWRHQENDFVDYNVQYLIPHAQSTRGPKLAVGDVNGDGWDDVYACGAKGQPGALLIQQANGAFVAANTDQFAADAASEDVDAVFFDADGNGSPDLYVVSGGNEYPSGDAALADRLYLNDGKGRFTKATGALPAILENKSCAAAADVDKDGDTDIFVGNLANSRAYGIPQTSYLLLNNGKAQFTVAGAGVINLSNIGMITSAAFQDFNRDGWNDLVVAGEFMPITVFVNKGGRFEQTVVPNATGWWQTLLVDDVNSDGNPDVLAGNWGWNNKFWSGKNGPVRLYVADFDRNGRTDQLLSYTLNGKEYPFLAKDEIERSLPVLKKHYLLYADYAGLEMKDAFYGFAETVEPLKAERLGSAVLYGDGKGGFTIQDLPADLQLAPIFSFQRIGSVSGQTLYLSGGNFFDVIPYEGRYDAQPLALFGIQQNKSISVLPQADVAGLHQQVRDIKRLRSASGKNLLVVAANNSGLIFLQERE